MKVERLIEELLKCNPEHNVNFCDVRKIEELKTEIDDGETWVSIYGSIESVNQHEQGVCIGFIEE